MRWENSSNWDSAQRTTTETQRCAWPAPSLATSGRSAAMARQALTKICRKRTSSFSSARILPITIRFSASIWRQTRRKTLIVADPRVTKTAMMADLFLPLKPRSDIALLNGLIHLLIRAGQIDCEYIAKHTSGFAELARFVEKYTPAYVAQITGLSEDLIIKTADLYGSAQAAFIGWTMGVNHSTQGAETVNAINNLALITGNIGRPALRHFRSPDSAMRWVRVKRASRRVCRDTESLKTPKTENSWRACGISVRIVFQFPRLGLSRHHRGRRWQKDSRTLDHCHESHRFVPESRRSEAGLGDTGFPGGAGWISSHANHRTCCTSSYPPPSGARRKARIRTPSGASAK